MSFDKLPRVIKVYKNVRFDNSDHLTKFLNDNNIKIIAIYSRFDYIELIYSKMEVIERS